VVEHSVLGMDRGQPEVRDRAPGPCARGESEATVALEDFNVAHDAVIQETHAA
jgi:hypothetical protein